MAARRILQVVASDQRRGAEVFAGQLADYLAERGDTVTTVALAGTDGPNRLPYEVVGDGRRFSPRTLRDLAGRVRAHDLTVVHGSDGLLPVAALAPALRRPFVYRNIGDPDHWAPARGAQLRVGAPLRRAAAVVALYDAARTSMVHRYRLDPVRVVTSPNAVAVEKFPRADAAARSASRAELGVTATGPVVGYLGALSAEKQPEVALRAVAEVTGAELLVAGTGPLGDRCAEVATEVAPDRVRFLGQVADPAQFLAALDVLVLTSRTEGLPGVLIEAALVGVPVVATPVGGIPDLLGELGHGVLTTSDRPEDVAAALRGVVDGTAGTRLPEPATVTDRFGIEAVSATWAEILDRVARRS